MKISGKQLLVGIVLLAVGLIGGGALASAASGGIEMNRGAGEAADVAKVNEVWKEYAATATEGDFERWISLWSENSIRLAPNAPRSAGLAQIRAAVEPLFELFDLEITVNPDEVRLLGDQAYSHGSYGMSLTPKGGGDTIEDTGKFLTILEKQADGSWKIAVDCFNTSIPAP